MSQDLFRGLGTLSTKTKWVKIYSKDYAPCPRKQNESGSDDAGLNDWQAHCVICLKSSQHCQWMSGSHSSMYQIFPTLAVNVCLRLIDFWNLRNTASECLVEIYRFTKSSQHCQWMCGWDLLIYEIFPTLPVNTWLRLISVWNLPNTAREYLVEIYWFMKSSQHCQWISGWDWSMYEIFPTLPVNVWLRLINVWNLPNTASECLVETDQCMKSSQHCQWMSGWDWSMYEIFPTLPVNVWLRLINVWNLPNTASECLVETDQCMKSSQHCQWMSGWDWSMYEIFPTLPVNVWLRLINVWNLPNTASECLVEIPAFALKGRGMVSRLLFSSVWCAEVVAVEEGGGCRGVCVLGGRGGGLCVCVGQCVWGVCVGGICFCVCLGVGGGNRLCVCWAVCVCGGGEDCVCVGLCVSGWVGGGICLCVCVCVCLNVCCYSVSVIVNMCSRWVLYISFCVWVCVCVREREKGEGYMYLSSLTVWDMFCVSASGDKVLAVAGTQVEQASKWSSTGFLVLQLSGWGFSPSGQVGSDKSLENE